MNTTRNEVTSSKYVPVRVDGKGLALACVRLTSQEEDLIQGISEISLQELTASKVNDIVLKIRPLITGLNLTGMELSTLPQQLGSCLSSLATLRLTVNRIQDWHWLADDSLNRSLRHLDLSSNGLAELPDVVTRLSGLVDLILDDNNLICLPSAICRMASLKKLSVSKNKLRYLPGGLLSKSNFRIDVSHNGLMPRVRRLQPGDFPSVPSLVDLAVRRAHVARLDWTSHLLPRTVLDRLQSVELCSCGNPCPSSSPICILIVTWECLVSLRLLNTVFIGPQGNHPRVVAFSVHTCSYQCSFNFAFIVEEL